MRGPEQEIITSERCLRSLERSRHRRAVVPRLRRKVAARKRRAGVLTAAMLAGSGGAVALAGDGSPRSGPPDVTSTSANLPVSDAIRDGLRLGNSGAAVTVVERRLHELGYDVEVDRLFDRKTERAVRQFQRAENLRVDGVVGRATWRALFDRDSAVKPAQGVEDRAFGAGPATDEAARTRFAVRMAAPQELSTTDRKRLGRGDSSPASKEGELVAIEFEGHAAIDDAPKPSAVDRSPEVDGASGAPPAPSQIEEGDDSANGASPEQTPMPPGGTSACGSATMIAPVEGATMTSSYRSADRPSHAGIDLAAPSGTPIRAVACGVVSFLQGTEQTGGYGNYICVKHTSSLTTCYAHLSSFSDEQVGDLVRQGQVIGYVGSTGHSTGPHLHFETRGANPYGPNDFDPAPYLGGQPIPGDPVGPSAIGGPDLNPAEPRLSSTTLGDPRGEDSGALGSSPADRSAARRASEEHAATVPLQRTGFADDGTQRSVEHPTMGGGEGHTASEPSSFTPPALGDPRAGAPTSGDLGDKPADESGDEAVDERQEAVDADSASIETPAADGEALNEDRGPAGSRFGAQGDEVDDHDAGHQASPLRGTESSVSLWLTPYLDWGPAKRP